MTYPVDQIAQIVKANGDLALGLADISRSSGEAWIEAGRKAAAAFTDRLRTATSEPKAFVVPDGSDFANELKTINEQTLEKTQTALKAWQKVWGDAWKVVADQKTFTGIIPELVKPWIASAAPASTRKAAAA